jgi:major type 1 subunit fimbrin (pilin)
LDDEGMSRMGARRPKRAARWLTALVACAGLSPGGPAQAQDSATITFQGSFTCSAAGLALRAGDGATQDGANAVLVRLPDISASNLRTAGNSANRTPFKLVLVGAAENSPCHYLYENSYIKFLPNPLVNMVTGNLYNSGTATGVELQLLGPPNGNPAGSATVPMDLTSTTNQFQASADANGVTSNNPLNFAVQYFGTGNATAGTVSSYVTVEVGYN